MKAEKAKADIKEVKLDLGCGPNPKEGYIGVDIIKYPNVHKVLDLTKPWPWKNNSVDEIHCSHFIEHFNSKDRAHLVCEMWRVLKVGGKVELVVPHWSNGRAYADPTHCWPPVSEMWFYYLDREWRNREAPHTNAFYKNIHFEGGWGYLLHPALNVRNDQFKQFAISYYKEAIVDVVGTLIKKE